MSDRNFPSALERVDSEAGRRQSTGAWGAERCCHFLKFFLYSTALIAGQAYALQTERPGRDLLVVDRAVQDVAAFERLARQSDGQGKSVLEPYALPEVTGNYHTVHLVSHGGDGWLMLGDVRVRLADPDYERLVAWLDTLLAPDGAVRLYACELAASEVGRRFVDDLSRRLARPVLASSDPTGNRELGGDWDLEYATDVARRSSRYALHEAGFTGLLAAPSDQEFQNGGPALLSNPATFDGVIYSHDAPASGKMARYNDSVDSTDRFGIIDGTNLDNGLLYHMSDGGTLNAPTGDIDFRFKSSSGDEFKLVSMEAGSITNANGVSNPLNFIVTITGYRDGAPVVSDTIDFEASDATGSVTYAKQSSYRDGVLTFDSAWEQIDEVRFTTSGKSSFTTLVIIDAIDFAEPLPVELQSFGIE